MRILTICLAGVLTVSVGTSVVLAQTADNVLVVINDKSDASQRIAQHYIEKRSIRPDHVVHLQTATDDEVNRQIYASTIETPISAQLWKGNLQDRILYIVLTKGVPLRVSGTDGQNGTIASVDSELTLLYRRMSGRPAPAAGALPNPYFLGTRPIAEARPFNRETYDIYLVTRLDAFTVDEAIGLVDKASKPVSRGRFVLDAKDTLVDKTGDNWLAEAGERLSGLGEANPVLLDKLVQGVRNQTDVLGYYSWGSNDPANRVRKFGLTFVPGGLAATFVSSDARTFQEPPPEWQPSGNWTDRRAWFGGSPQSLIGDLIREGATGAAGHVAEPFLGGTVRPQILFPAYMAGMNLAEAFYLAIPGLSWQTVVIGDPLCKPVDNKALTHPVPDARIDPGTDMPPIFGKRVEEVVRAQMAGRSDTLVKLATRASARLNRGDTAGAQSALEELTAQDPTIVAAQVQLAGLYELAGKNDAAEERYRQVLKAQPNNALALNNLAYHLAVRKKQPAEAKPFADRALSITPRDPAVLDTAGWIEHLLGDDPAASRLLSAAAAGAAGNAEIRLHAAIAYAGAGAKAAARTELEAAVKLDPSFEQRDEVKALRKQLAEKH